MLNLVTNLDAIAAKLSLMRVNLLHANEKPVTQDSLQIYEELKVDVIFNNIRLNFHFHNYTINKAGEINGFGGEINFKMPFKKPAFKSLALDISSPQIIDGDVYYDDHAFFAIESESGHIKLFHTCNFERPHFDFEKPEDVNWEEIEKRFVKKYKPKIETAVSSGGISRRGAEIYNLSTNQFSAIIKDFRSHIIRENQKIKTARKHPNEAELFRRFAKAEERK